MTDRGRKWLKSSYYWIAVVTMLLAVLVACGGSSASTEAPEATATLSATASPSPTTLPATATTTPAFIASSEGTPSRYLLTGTVYRACLRSSTEGFDLVRSKRYRVSTASLVVVYRIIVRYCYACRRTILPQTGARRLLRQALHQLSNPALIQTEPQRQ